MIFITGCGVSRTSSTPHPILPITFPKVKKLGSKRVIFTVISPVSRINPSNMRALISGILWLLMLLSHSTFAQPDHLAQLPIDSSLLWMETNVVENPDSFHEVALQTLTRAYGTQDHELIARVHDQLASCHAYHRPFTYDSILYHSEKTVAHLEKTNDSIKLADSYMTLASDFINTNEADRGQEMIFKGITVYEALANEAGLAKAYRLLATLYNGENESDLAIKYGNQALEIAQKNENFPTAGIALLELSHAYRKSGQFDKAYQAIDTCIHIAETQLPMPDYIGILLRAYAGRGEISEAAGNYELGLNDHFKAWELAKEAAGENQGTDTYRIGIGNILFLQQKYNEALPHLLAGVRAFETTESSVYPEIWEHYRDIANCYEELGNYPAALEYHKRSKEVYDTLMSNKIANLETEALVKYETGKKDQALLEQAEIIRQQKRIQWLSVGITGSFAVLLVSLFYFYRKNKKNNAILAAKNNENELLLKEIHHRVKNNLEMVSSLLKLQSIKVKDRNAKEVMQASRSRVQSMGIIHQKLYQGENLGTIEMLDYFKNLSENIVDAFGAHEQVEVYFDMEPVELDVDTAVPIGLIVNELLTNALKYAFPEGREGKIELSLREINQHQLQLVVADNGIGQSEDDQPQGTGFGSQLVRLLTDQLQGSMQANYQNGTKLYFELEKANLN